MANPICRSLLLGSTLLCPPLLSATAVFDESCSEYPSLGAEAIALPHGMTLYQHQDDQSVWFCLTLPEDSFGMIELTVDAPGLDSPLMIHVSAQLGEWPVDQPDLAPPNARSDRWWNQQGWYANAARFNGEDEVDGKSQVRFIPSPARELQLQTSRFGKGLWKTHWDIRGIRTAEGGSASILWPSPEDSTASHDLMVD